MYTLDTNAIIYYLKYDPRAVRLLNDILKQDVPLYISTITEIELLGFFRLSNQEIQQIEAILQTITTIPVDSRLARVAGQIRRTYRLNIADSAIAATALFTGTTLLTRNIRDFKKVHNLSLKII